MVNFITEIRLVGKYGLAALILVVGTVFFFIAVQEDKILGLGMMGIGIVLIVWIISVELKPQEIDNRRRQIAFNNQFGY